MAYIKTDWNDKASPGISAEKMDKIEQGIYDAHENIALIAGQQMPEEYLKAAVDDYINENQAGLAKKEDVEEATNQLSSEIADVNKAFYETTTIENADFVVGGFNTDGTEVDSTNRVRTQSLYTKDYVYVDKSTNAPSDWQFRVLYYNANGFVKMTEWVRSKITIDRSYLYFRVLGGNADTVTSETLPTINTYLNLGKVNHTNYNYKGGITSYLLSDITESGYYSFSSAEVASIEDRPTNLIRAGVLRVENMPVLMQVFQSIMDFKGNMWFRYGTNPFVQINGSTKEVNWVAIGDSITHGWTSAESGTYLDESNSWVNLVAQKNGWNVSNQGVGGSGYLAVGSELDKLSGKDHINTINFSNADIVTIAYGVNDWKYNQVLGTINDDKNTDSIYGAMKYVIEKILTDNPHCKIVVITPLNCCAYGDVSTNWGIGYPFSNNGTLEDIFNAQKEVCEYYGIEYIDMTHNSVVNRFNIKSLLLDDVHPSKKTYSALASELAKKINFK